jgi:(1->4)-alpha-D-glucan 1-alpha-D-glucosylmutase
VPDFYQGSEFWQLSLVDPDNRHAVDYKRATAMLESLRKRETEDPVALIRELAANPLRDEMKLFVTYRALAFRKAHRELFVAGEYIPLAARGACAERVCAFARRLGEQVVVVVAPRWTHGLADWGDTALDPPAAGDWIDVLTGLIPAGWHIADLLAQFPVAMPTLQL